MCSVVTSPLSLDSASLSLLPFAPALAIQRSFGSLSLWSHEIKLASMGKFDIRVTPHSLDRPSLGNSVMSKHIRHNHRWRLWQPTKGRYRHRSPLERAKPPWSRNVAGDTLDDVLEVLAISPFTSWRELMRQPWRYFNIHHLRGWRYGDMIIAFAKKEHCCLYEAWRQLMRTRFQIQDSENSQVVDLSKSRGVVNLTGDD